MCRYGGKGGVSVWGEGGGGQDGCEQRIEVFVKIQEKKIGGGGGQGGCERTIEVFGKIHKKKSGGVGLRRGSGWWGGSGWM